MNTNLIIIGSGAVSRCLQTILLKERCIDPTRVTIVDPDKKALSSAPFNGTGATIINETITRENYEHFLITHVKPHDTLIDLSVNIDTIALIDWCQKNDVIFINTSIELWDPYRKDAPITERTLYPRHLALKKKALEWGKSGATAIVEHGANPGLVSHWTKKTLKEIAEKILTTSTDQDRNKQLKQALEHTDFAKLCQLTGTKVIHISERDTQITGKPKEVNEFVNTWSVDGLYEEGLAPPELGWGTHEQSLPSGSFEHTTGPKNQICLSSIGMNTWMRSWVPSGDIIGMLIRHGEAFTISDHLTVWEHGKAVYRPTVHYVYTPSDSTIASSLELKMRHYDLQPKKRILYDEVITGRDDVGVLLLGHDFNGWWQGSRLTIEETRKLIGGNNNATTLQVAASVFAAYCWSLKNPHKGYCVPDDLPYDEILAIANPYLGECVSIQTDWSPTKNRVNPLAIEDQNQQPVKDQWQFNDFVFSVNQE